MRIEDRYTFFLFISLLLVMVSCSPKVRQNLLNTFFDGVPSEENNDDKIVENIENIDSSSVLIVASEDVKNKIFYHKPFQEKKCSKCHDGSKFGGFLAEQPLLCYQCHESKTGNREYQHGPVNAGLCTKCHSPHKSNHDKQLLLGGNELCENCHSSENRAKNIIHKNINTAEKRCLECHDPHSSDTRFMLKKGACYECHDALNEREFTHGPVAANFCSLCHESHESKNKYWLVLDGQDLCLNCHNQSDIFKNEAHLKEGNNNCTNCHNPHGGSKRFMLN